MYFTVYGLMHYYAFRNANAALAPGTLPKATVILFMLLMIMSPMLVRLSERKGYEGAAIVLSYVGYIWMGFLLFFVTVSVFLDLCRAVVYFINTVFTLKPQLRSFGSGASFYIPLAAAAVIAVYGYVEALDVKTEHLTIKSRKIPGSIGTIKVVQISDLHIGLIVRTQRIRLIAGIIKREAPDLLVSTGDLVDAQTDDIDAIAGLLNEIKPRYGKYAITGNHEFYAGLEHSLNFTKGIGFTVLRKEGLTIEGCFNIAGVDDPSAAYYNIPVDGEALLLSGLPRDKFTILLKHRPLIDNRSVGLFDLQLSGHTHKGQIFPFNLVTRAFYHVHAGTYNAGRGSLMYVSRGTGTWGPPIRFLSPPEVTVIELSHDDSVVSHFVP